MRHRFENHDLVTERRSQMIDVTSDVIEVVERSEVKVGSPGTELEFAL